MRTLTIPYHAAYLQPETRAFGERNGAQFADLTNDDCAYWRTFAELWYSGSSFAICEHDVVPTDEQWNELRECAEPWCVFAYDRLGNYTRTMGFCGFDPERLGQTIRADQWTIPQMTQESREKQHAYANAPAIVTNILWNHVDGVVWTFLGARGYAPHVHDGLVRHVRDRRKGE